jgi:hypothetical protein
LQGFGNLLKEQKACKIKILRKEDNFQNFLCDTPFAKLSEKVQNQQMTAKNEG